MAKSPTKAELSALLDQISQGVARVQGVKVADSKDILEAANLEAERAKIELGNESLLLTLREKYGRNIIRYLWAYSGVALALLLLDGATDQFNLPESTLTALVGGAAVSVLGVVGTVAAGLFKTPPPKP